MELRVRSDTQRSSDETSGGRQSSFTKPDQLLDAGEEMLITFVTMTSIVTNSMARSDKKVW